MKKRAFIFLIATLILVSFSYAKDESGCPELEINSQSTSAFISEIPDLNSHLTACPPQIPSPMNKFFKNENIVVSINRNDGTTALFVVYLKDGKLSSLKDGSDAGSYFISMDECVFDSILKSDNKLGALGYLYVKKKISVRAAGFAKKMQFMMFKPFFKMGMKRVQKQTDYSCGTVSEESAVGEHPGFRVCEFYQKNKKLVTCGALKAADTFCIQAMQSRFAVAAKCEENGIIVCKNPCDAQGQIAPKSCAFDNDRPRGKQAVPLDFCPQKLQPSTPEKKNAGEICKHGGECKSGNCVGDGPGGTNAQWVYRCSCNPFKFETGNC